MREKIKPGVNVGSVLCAREGILSSVARSRKCGLLTGSSDVTLSRIWILRTGQLHWRNLVVVLYVLLGVIRNLPVKLLLNAGT